MPEWEKRTKHLMFIYSFIPTEKDPLGPKPAPGLSSILLSLRTLYVTRKMPEVATEPNTLLFKHRINAGVAFINA